MRRVQWQDSCHTQPPTCTHRNDDETVLAVSATSNQLNLFVSHFGHLLQVILSTYTDQKHPITRKVTDSLPTVTMFIAHYPHSLSLDLFVRKNWPARYTNLRPHSMFVLCGQIFMLYEKIRICCFIFVLMSTMQSMPTLILWLCACNFCPWSLENKSLAWRNKPTIWYLSLLHTIW